MVMNVFEIVLMIFPIYQEMKIFAMMIVLIQIRILLLLKNKNYVLIVVNKIINIDFGEKIKYVWIAVIN